MHPLDMTCASLGFFDLRSARLSSFEPQILTITCARPPSFSIALKTPEGFDAEPVLSRMTPIPPVSRPRALVAGAVNGRRYPSR